MNEMDRIILYSLLSCIARYKLEYAKNIEINQDFSNSIYNMLNRCFLSKGMNIRILRDPQQFKKVLVNELIYDSLATLDSNYNCVFNSNNQQCEDFINDFSNIALYRDIIYSLIRKYMIKDVFKLEYIEEPKESIRKNTVSIEDDSKVVFLGPKIEIEVKDNITEDIPISFSNNIKETEEVVTQVIYSSPEGKAIKKTLKKDI